MTTPKLNLASLNLGDARRRAAPVADRLLMSDAALDELLNPMRYHASGRGERRANELKNAYNAFRDSTVDQILVSAGIPAAHVDNFERDLTQRAEKVNESFRLLACHALAEMGDPTPPEPPVMARSGPAAAGPHLGHFGPADPVGVARHTVDELNRKNNHFWNSVARRVEHARWDARPPWNEMPEDEDEYEYPDVRR